MKLMTHAILAVALFALSVIAMAAPYQRVSLDTSMGVIVLELDHDKAPISVKNFLSYVNEGFYNGTVFHRVMDGFMIQGGGFGEDMQKKATRPPIKNEANNGLKNVRGSIAMARTNVVDSATAQFFINVTDNAFLNFKSPTPQSFGYAVFGKVIDGMGVVDKIKKLPTHREGMQAKVPTPQVVIKSATILTQ